MDELQEQLSTAKFRLETLQNNRRTLGEEIMKCVEKFELATAITIKESAVTRFVKDQTEVDLWDIERAIYQLEEKIRKLEDSE